MYKIIKSATNHDAEFGKVRYFYRTEPNRTRTWVRFGSVKFGFGRSLIISDHLLQNLGMYHTIGIFLSSTESVDIDIQTMGKLRNRTVYSISTRIWQVAVSKQPVRFE